MIIWIASYPKSGNTWLRSLLTSYYFSEDGKFDFGLLKNIKQFPSKDFFSKRVESIDEAAKNWLIIQKKIKDLKKARFLKTHNVFGSYKGNNFTSQEFTLGAIIVVRDPRNVITSIKNHFGFSDYEIALKYMQTEGAYMEGEDNARYAIVDSWKTHFISWMKNQSLKRISIRYEDLVNSPEKEFTKVVEFVDALSLIHI